MSRFVKWIETLGGARPFDTRTPARALALGIWWTTLLLATLAFVGRATRFVYVDF